jgi:Uma2 family endonuclease
MSERAPARMTADEFLIWAMQQPEGRHYELEDGVVVEAAAERVVHAKCKFMIARRLAEAVEAASLPCEVYTDGIAVRIDATTIFEPDAMVRCGPQPPDDATEITDPMIVVEVRSPTSGWRDSGTKLEGYFQLPSVRHYLIVKTGNRSVIHHRRDEAGEIHTRIIANGPVPLDPPGIVLADFFPATA